MLLRRLLLSVAALLCSAKFSSAQTQGYYGKYIGKLKTLHHKVTGEVFAVDARTLHIRDFYYDGEGPAAYFYAGNSKTPSASGFRINDEKGSSNPLQRYQKKHVTITLPDGKTLNNVKWLSVWCEEFAVNFGDVKIPKNLDYPKPQKIDPLNGVHLVSSEPIVVVDAQTLLIPSFSYDGEAPDAKFWVGHGAKPSPQGIRVPDENGKENPLRRYDRKTIVLTLPGDTTIFDIGHFGVWCEAFTVDFGHVRIPKGLNVPPSLKMLGVAPQSKLNCEVLWDDLAFEVRWAVAGDSVVLQLVSKLEDGEYMSFGLSGDNTRSKMIGGDVVVAWVDKSTLKGFAYDYFLDAKSQCAGPRGSCPDERLRENTNNVRLLNAAMVNGYSIVTYQRPVKAQDELDRSIYTNGTQPIIWAIGPLNSRNEVSYHSITNKGDVFLDFGRPPKWNCPIPETDSSAAASGTPSKPASEQQPPASEEVTTVAPARRRVQATPAPAPKTDAWYIPPIQCDEPADGVFYAQLGPTGGKHGYPAITGHVGWGISWYINGLLIPEIYVVRGKTYTFVTEGGQDPEIPAKYHPFYITDDPVGGYEHKTPEERAEVRIFAGVQQNRRGEVYPTGVGRLCNWTPDPDQPSADEFVSFGAYQRTLSLICDPGDPGTVQWTPDKNTPDTVYYQCFSHRYLGWKIHVLDSCDQTAAGSEQIKIRVPAVEEDDLDEDEDDVEGELQGRPSIRVATRVKPNGVFINTKDEFSKQTDHKYIPLNEFPQLPSNTQQQEFPFSYEPVTTEATIAQDDGTISEAFVPPPALQKEPIQSPQFENNESSISGQGLNASYQNPGAQLQNPSYFTYQMVKEVNSSATQADPNFAQQTGISIQLPSQQLVPTIINAQALPLGSIAPNQQLNPIALPNPQLLNPTQITVGSTQPIVNVQAQVNSGQAQVDASRNPTAVHTTTLQPINYSPPDETPVSVLTDEKAEPEVEAAASSPVNVTEYNPEPAEPKTKIPVPIKAMGLVPGKMSHHTTLIPQVYSRIPVHPSMVFQRPLQPYTLTPHFRRPVPHRGFSRPPPPTIFRPQFVGAASTQHNYIIKKPFYRPPPQRPMTMPPQYHRPAGKPRIPMQHTATSIKTYHITLPPQNQPLKLRKVLSSSTTTTSTTTPLPPPTPAQVDQAGSIKPSTPILPSDVIVLNARDSLTIPVAVNTGFNPHSVVVEGGFKPIITSKNAVAAAAQDRSSVVNEKEEEVQSVQEEKDADKQENEEVINKSEEAMIAELASEVVAAINEEERKENPFQGQQPESFEPMFIPSPPDRRNGTDAKKPILPEGLIPPVPHLHHRNSPQPNRKNGHPYMMIRPRPGLVRRPLYPNNIVPPFRIRGSPTFRYQQSEEILDDETPMAAERMDSYYLPPDSAIPPGVVVTYDGKSVADTGLSSPVGVKNTRTPIGTADFIRGTPQVVPYRGEIPPPVPENIRPENIPQLNKKNQQLAQSLPEQFKQQNDAFPDPPSIQSTQLKLVQNDELISEGSENKEVTISKDKTKKQTEKKSATSKEEGEIMTTVDDRWPFSTNVEQTGDELSTVPSAETEGTTNKQNAESLTKKSTERREKRSAHHEPGHEGHHSDDTNHQHSDHDHTDHQHMDHDHQNSNHNHSQDEKRSAASHVVLSSAFLLLCIVISMYL